MKLKELLLILPENLDISIEHDGRKTSSLVQGIMSFTNLIEREVIYCEPNYVHSIGIQSFDVKVK